MNYSGVNPCGHKVLVKPDEIERKTKGGIVIPETEAEKRDHSQTAGLLVAVGPDAFQNCVTTKYRLMNKEWIPVEMEVTGQSESFANVGDRIAYAKYQGENVVGEDGEKYRLLNDMDITARISDAVQFTDLHARERIGEK